MILTIWNGQSFDTDRDLTSAERHILQKLMAYKSLACSIEEFRGKKSRAFQAGWNESGPVPERPAMRLLADHLEKQLVSRLESDGPQQSAQK